MWHVLKEIPHHSPQSIPKCQFTGTYILWLNISNLDRNVYVRIQHSKIPRFAQDSLGECWKPEIQTIEKLNPKERSWASSFPEKNSFAVLQFDGLQLSERVNETACVFPEGSTTRRLENWKTEKLNPEERSWARNWKTENLNFSGKLEAQDLSFNVIHIFLRQT